MNLNKYDVCDNMDLPTVLHEYEAYYAIKFGHPPKITKRIKDTETKRSTLRSVSSAGGTCSK